MLPHRALPLGTMLFRQNTINPDTSGRRIRVEVTMQMRDDLKLDWHNAWDGFVCTLSRSNSVWSWSLCRLRSARNPTESEAFGFVSLPPSGRQPPDFRAQITRVWVTIRAVWDDSRARQDGIPDVDEARPSKVARCSWDQANSTTFDDDVAGVCNA